MARAARDLAEVPGAFPGAKTAATAYEAYVEQILNGETSDQITDSLERKMSRLPVLGSLPIAWALTVAYENRGDGVKAAAMRSYIASKAPSCRALHLRPVFSSP